MVIGYENFLVMQIEINPEFYLTPKHKLNLIENRFKCSSEPWTDNFT